MELPKALIQILTYSPVSKDDNLLYGDFPALKLRKFLEVEEKDQQKQFENDQN